MFFEGGGKGGALANGVRDLQNHAAQGRVLFVLAEAIQCLWNGNRRTQQRAHFAGERGDILSADSLSEADFRSAAFICRRAGDGNSTASGAQIKLGRVKPAFAEQLKRGLAVFGLNDAGNRRAGSFDCLIAEGVHSRRSPEDTRRISSSEVMPAAALSKASWCMVSMVCWALAFNWALERFCRINSRNAPVMGSSSKMPTRPL